MKFFYSYQMNVEATVHIWSYVNNIPLKLQRFLQLQLHWLPRNYHKFTSVTPGIPGWE